MSTCARHRGQVAINKANGGTIAAYGDFPARAASPRTGQLGLRWNSWICRRVRRRTWASDLHMPA
jgi:hypothetical protein